MSKKKTIFVFSLLSAISLILSYLVIVKTMRGASRANQEEKIRKPAVAGVFYSNNASELNLKLQSFFDASKTISKKDRLKILFVPHAGIDYSGEVAAAGFKQLEDQNYSKIILLGTSHKIAFDSVAIYSQGFWQTPLGKTKINKELASNLIDSNQKIYGNTDFHQEEHSLEIELIFLQKILKNFEIVPVLIGQPEEKVLDGLAKKIAENLDEETLLVVSTDLSHYLPYEAASEIDRQTINTILKGNPDEFKNMPNPDNRACGYQPILVALKTASLLDGTDFEEIKYANSGDTSGDKNRVVGYAAIGVWRKDNDFQKEALLIARQTLARQPLQSPKSTRLFQKLGAFVTLKNQEELRGCIGEFEPDKPLYEVIREMTIAATKDPRFPPVSDIEINDIKIEISVMSPRKKITSWKEIELGKHGVVIQYGNQAGTFLPQVATETGWDLEEFLSQLCEQKAGLPAHCYKSPEVNLYVFEVQIFKE